MQTVVLSFTLVLCSILGACSVPFSNDDKPLKYEPMVKKGTPPVVSDEETTTSTPPPPQPRDSTTASAAIKTTKRPDKEPRMFEVMPRYGRTIVPCNGKVRVTPGEIYTFTAPYMDVSKCKYTFKNPGKVMLTIDCNNLSFDLCRSFLKVKTKGPSTKYCHMQDFETETSVKKLKVIFKNKFNLASWYNCSVFATEPPPPPPPSDCKCGQLYPGARIVGGNEVMPNSITWQVALVAAQGTEPFCGGSIIGRELVLTAAHCIEDLVSSPSAISVVVGEHDYTTSSETSSTQRHSIMQIIMHPGYDSFTYDNDIALLRLSSPITFTEKVAPVCLPADDRQTYTDANATVSGWGTLSSGGSQPDVLHAVTVPVISNSDCTQKYSSSSYQITVNMLCAGLDQGGKDSCQGDSGGPLATDYFHGSAYELIGVVSWGISCAQPNYPGVYARVSKYLTWINSEAVLVGGLNSCPAA